MQGKPPEEIKNILWQQCKRLSPDFIPHCFLVPGIASRKKRIKNLEAEECCQTLESNERRFRRVLNVHISGTQRAPESAAKVPPLPPWRQLAAVLAALWRQFGGGTFGSHSCRAPVVWGLVKRVD
ncbi:hypothetical protein B0H16DRAFT_1472227 [Mycena metata]|uniref:Uncharacterized protein n=1 Tax=Mycena metata TaxID=1033252 RepID=A0AAD7HP77_9AGAR|nr:hypothetical protein B0H16DRAFT_1472227 [Mycena metata]